jgi:transcription antitermination factor NusG
MPILRKESEIFPDGLFTDPAIAGPWAVAHVRSRQEKLFARFLRERGIPFYLPQVESRKKRGGRNFVSHLPLFPGYVFLRRTAGADVLWRSNVVAGVIDVEDQDRLALELRQIRSLQEAGAILTPDAPEIAPGDAVRITDGAFRDYVGVVVRERGALRLLVSVSIVRKTVAVEFPREVLTPVAAAPARRRR